MAGPSEILEFWFGALDPDGFVVEDRSALWWGKNPDLDARVRARFEDDVREAAAGGRDGWAETATGSLALILCLDQFPRNMYRDSPRAFAFDGQAQAVALEGIARGFDERLVLVQRAFYYLPLEHAEDPGLQRRSVELFTELHRQAPTRHERTFAEYLDYARRHAEIIERFGRFPHRNSVLGRESTPEELAFLATPGSSF